MTRLSPQDAKDGGVEYRGTGFYASVIVALVIAAILLVFAIQNTTPVTVTWLGFEITAPLFAWVLGAALLAVIADGLIGLLWRARRRTRLSSPTERSPAASALVASSAAEGMAEAENPAATDLGQEAPRYDTSRR